MTIEKTIKQALLEDLGNADYSSLACVDESITGKMKLIAKDAGIIAGIDVARMALYQVDPTVMMEAFMKDGDEIKHDDVVFAVKGPARSLLAAERTLLNFVQRMSGIATATRQYVTLLKGYKTKLLDTRKTTPNMRAFEKYAVSVGGAENHRFGLFDMIILKDNHIDFAGGIELAIDKTREYLNKRELKMMVEIETRNLQEVAQVVARGGVNRIMLDNFSPDEIREALKMINGKYETEASGAITLSNLKEYAETGVDYISIGAFTHQIKSLDLSLKYFK